MEVLHPEHFEATRNCYHQQDCEMFPKNEPVLITLFSLNLILKNIPLWILNFGYIIFVFDQLHEVSNLTKHDQKIAYIPEYMYAYRVPCVISAVDDGKSRPPNKKACIM